MALGDYDGGRHQADGDGIDYEDNIKGGSVFIIHGSLVELDENY